MWYALFASSLVGFRNGSWLAVAVLNYALYILLHAALGDVGVAQTVVLFATILALPLVCFCVGLYFDQFIGGRVRVFSLLAIPLLSWLVLGEKVFFDYLNASQTILSSSSSLALISYFVSLVSSSFFIVTALIVALTIPIIFFESILAWLCRATFVRYPSEIRALRPIFLVLVISMTLNLIAGLCVRELWPTTLIAMAMQ